MNRFAFLLTILLLIAVGSAFAAPESKSGASKSYNFKDAKGVNAIQFLLDSELEPMVGTANGIEGTVSFDPANPKSMTGKITLGAKSVKCSNSRMTKKLHGAKWLQIDKNQQISFTLKKVLRVGKSPKRVEGQPWSVQLEVLGELNLLGVSKEIPVTLLVKFLPGALKKRNHGKKDGDLLRLSTVFSILRSDFNLGSAMPLVSDKIELRLSLIGTCPNK